MERRHEAQSRLTVAGSETDERSPSSRAEAPSQAAQQGCQVPRAALLFMETVQQARATNEGPFRALAPIFQMALEQQRGQLFNVELAGRVLQPILGPNFGTHAVEAFIPALEGLGWLQRAQLTGNEAVYRVSHAVPSLDECEAVNSSQAKLDRLFEAFSLFLNGVAPLLRFSLKKEQFQWQLFRWATSLDGSDKAKLISLAETLAAGQKPRVKDAFLDETQSYSRVDRQLSVEFAGFVKWLVRQRRAEISDVAALTELGLAMEFLDEARSPSTNADATFTTVFVLDAPVLLDRLGLSGTARKESISRYLDVLKQRGASIATLSHCLEELAEIIRAVLVRPAASRFGLTGDALRERPDLVKFARAVEQQPDQAVKRVGIEVLHFDPSAPLNARHFPEEFIDRFRNTATWHDQSKTDQRYRDALSIAFVMRRRQGKPSSDVFDTPFVLVTRNSTFTEFAKSFVRRSLSVPDYAFGPAIEIKTLAAFVWLRFGSTVDPKLPQLQLIAACDRILASNSEIIRKAENRLRDLRGQDVATALLSNHQAVLDLIVASGGDPDVIDGANGEELLRAVTATAEDRGRAEERARAAVVQKEFQEQVEEVQREAHSQRLAIQRYEADKVQARADADSLRSELERRSDTDARRAEIMARRITQESSSFAGYFITVLWIAVLIIAVYGQFFVWDPQNWSMTHPWGLATDLVTIAATVLLCLFGIRFIARGRLDLAAYLRRNLIDALIRSKLRKIEPPDEQNRVRVALNSTTECDVR